MSLHQILHNLVGAAIADKSAHPLLIPDADR
jgi:hypothetical protein